MKSLLVSIICAFSTPAFAADQLDRTEINRSLSQIKSISLKHQGQDGVWFPRQDAEFLLDLVSTKLKLSLDIIDNQNTQIDALKSAVEGYKQSNKSYLELAELNRKMFDTAMQHIPNLNPPEPSWYENTKATFIYGLVVGGVVVFGTTYLATKALENK